MCLIYKDTWYQVSYWEEYLWLNGQLLTTTSNPISSCEIGFDALIISKGIYPIITKKLHPGTLVLCKHRSIAFLRFFYRDNNISYGLKLLFSCALIMQCSLFNSWVAEAMGVKFLAQGNSNSSRMPQLGVKPGTLWLQPWRSTTASRLLNPLR